MIRNSAIDRFWGSELVRCLVRRVCDYFFQPGFSCLSSPANCVQYYTGVGGIIKSFNFDQGAQLEKMNYRLCFRQEMGIVELNAKREDHETAIKSAKCCSYEIHIFLCPFRLLRHVFLRERNHGARSFHFGTRDLHYGVAGNWINFVQLPLLDIIKTCCLKNQARFERDNQLF